MKGMRDKGYTLVEMVVAVAVLLIVFTELGALVINSTTLYRNGSYEVELQEEAQQVILQLEDLLMGTNKVNGLTKSSDTFGSVDSDVMRLETEVYKYDAATGLATGMESVVYEIGLPFAVHGGGIEPRGDVTEYGTEDYNYEKLVMAKTVGGSTSYAVLANGVHSFHLDTTDTWDDTHSNSTESLTGFTEADHIQVNLEMQNEQYSYNSSKDVYLRNQIGTGGPKANFKTTTKYALELNVRRLHSYDLSKVVPDGYNYFMFEDSSDEDEYLLVNSQDDAGYNSGSHIIGSSSAHTYVSCKDNSSKLGDWSKSEDSCVLICGTDPAMTTKLKVRLYTEAFQMDDMPLYVHTSTSSKPLYSTMPVHGVCICPECLKKAEVHLQYTIYMPGDFVSYAKKVQLNNVMGGTVEESLDDNTNRVDFENIKIAEGKMENGSSVTMTVPIVEIKTWNNQNRNFENFNVSNGKLYDQCAPTFTLGRDQNGNSINNFTVACESHVTGSWNYYYYVIEKCGGYIRLQLKCEFKDGTNQICNMDRMPMKSGNTPSDDQLDLLWEWIQKNDRKVS